MISEVELAECVRRLQEKLKHIDATISEVEHTVDMAMARFNVMIAANDQDFTRSELAHSIIEASRTVAK